MNLLLLLACTGTDSADTGETGDTSAPRCVLSERGICTWAGTGDAGYNGDGLPLAQSMLYFPMGVTFSPYGKPMVADWNNHKIRVVEADGTFRTVMGTDFLGDGPPDASDLTAPGADGTTVHLNHPTDQVYRPDGILVSASWHTHKIRTLDPETGLVIVLAGRGSGYAGDDEAAPTSILFNQPRDVALDAAGNLYIADMRNQRIRKLTEDGAISTIVGNGTKSFCGDEGPGKDACLNFPQSANPEPGGSMVLSADEQWMYIADTENHRIRAYDLTNDVIRTIVGSGTAGFAGDGGDALAAELNYPRDLALLDENTLLIADTENHRIRSVDLDTGTISTLAGTGTAAFAGDGGAALDASLNRPFNVNVDTEGLIYISDTFNHRIRVVQP